MLKLEIGDVIEFTIQNMGIINFPAGTKAEIVGKGRKNIFYARLFYTGILMQVSANDKHIKKVKGSFLIK